jgi:hypothetical protein
MWNVDFVETGFIGQKISLLFGVPSNNWFRLWERVVKVNRMCAFSLRPIFMCQIWGICIRDYEEYCYFGCDAMYGRCLHMFRRNLLLLCLYKGWAIKFSPCTATFNDLLCLHVSSVFNVEVASSNQQGRIKQNFYIYCSPIIQSLKLRSNICLLVFSRTAWSWIMLRLGKLTVVMTSRQQYEFGPWNVRDMYLLRVGNSSINWVAPLFQELTHEDFNAADDW